MANTSLECPHCYSENVFFYSVGAVQIEKSTELIVDGGYYTRGSWAHFFACAKCKGGVVQHLSMKAYNQDELQNPHKADGVVEDYDWKVIKRYPKQPPVKAPEHTPDNIANFFRQARHSYQTAIAHMGREAPVGFDSSVIMCRKVLETSCKHIHPKGSGNLKKRIDTLADQHIITPAIKDWATEIRGIGNETAHEEAPINKRTATDIINFTEMFLMYIFTLPGQLAERRQQTKT